MSINLVDRINNAKKKMISKQKLKNSLWYKANLKSDIKTTHKFGGQKQPI